MVKPPCTDSTSFQPAPPTHHRALSRSVFKDDHIRQSQVKRNAKRLHGPECGTTPPPLAQVAHSTRVNMRYPSKVRLGPAAQDAGTLDRAHIHPPFNDSYARIWVRHERPASAPFCQRQATLS